MAHPVYKVISKYDYDYTQDGVVPQGVSLTVPDQSLTLRQIVDRFSNGMIPPGLIHDVQYDDPDVTIDDDVSPLNNPNVDLIDIQEYEREYREIESRIAESERRKQASKKDAHLQDEPPTPANPGNEPL
ncbi:hypothetical protein [Dipodfec virus RodF1_76]|uniref:Uncharacterized protein n=1 Tax=Dipodfec virus RodF1_76 TaxID=2929311 RepID=A0A976R7W1_9VIRU|nr:hypothetical protein [Dipodfec virus RodF1_76]